MATPLVDDTDHRTYTRVGYTLLGGLLVSIAVMAVGLLLTAISGKNTSQVLPLDQVVPHLLRGNAPALLDIGILLLFATPLVGVLVAVFEFLRQDDLFSAATTGLLLVMLVIAFAVALH